MNGGIAEDDGRLRSAITAGLFGVTAGFVQENGRLCAERGLLAGAVTL
jgi:hypothetical protein